MNIYCTVLQVPTEEMRVKAGNRDERYNSDTETLQ